jgi:hypothetical protein
MIKYVILFANTNLNVNSKVTKIANKAIVTLHRIKKQRNKLVLLNQILIRCFVKFNFTIEKNYNYALILRQKNDRTSFECLLNTKN